MWRSVFLHEFLDRRITNFQALPGAPTPGSLTLAPVAEAGGGNAVTIAPGTGFEHVLAQPLPQVIGVSVRVRMIYPINPLPQMFPVIRLGAGAELLFWPVTHPLSDGSGTEALARVWVGSGFRNLGNVVLPALGFAEIRFDWHTSGQARLMIDGRLVAYHNATAPGAMFPVDRVAFGMPGVPAAPRPLYRVARVFVRVLERPDALAHLSKLLPKTKPVPDQNRCRLRIMGNALAVLARLRQFMAETHQTLSQPWTAQAGPASGPFRPEAVEAHALATAAAGELIRMLRTNDFAAAERFLEPFAAFLQILRDARPVEFAALAAEVETMEIVPEDCRALLEPSAEDREAFAAIGELLTRASDSVRSVAGDTDVADLQALQQFAADNGFGLTAPLNHARVVRLAEYWLPEMRFYWDERFHPVTLDDIFAMAEDGFAALPPVEQEEWRVAEFVRAGSGGASRAFDPPVVHVPDGTVQVPAPQGGLQLRKVVRVLNEGTPGRGTLGLPEVGPDAVITHGASFGRSSKFFGPRETMAGESTGTEDDPWKPRADEPDPARPGERRPRTTVMAALLNLLDLLKYELTIAEAEAEGFDYPPTACAGSTSSRPSCAARHRRLPTSRPGSSAGSSWTPSRRTRRASSYPSRPRAGGSTAWPGAQ